MASESGVHYIPIQHIAAGEPLHTASQFSLLSDDPLFDGYSLRSASSCSSSVGSCHDLYQSHRQIMSGSTPNSRCSTLSREGSAPRSPTTSTSSFTRIVVQRADTPTRTVPKPQQQGQRVVRTVLRSQESISSAHDSEATLSPCSTPTSGYISDAGSLGTTPTPSTSGVIFPFPSKLKVSQLSQDLLQRQQHNVFDISQNINKQISVLGSPQRKPGGNPPTSLDSKLLQLRRELLNLRQLDISLLKQLWSLGDSIKDYKTMLNEQQDNVSLDGSFSDLYGMCSEEGSTESNVSIPIMYQSSDDCDSPKRRSSTKLEISSEWVV